LYGTIFASTAAHSRLCADVVRMTGGYPREDGGSRLKWRNRFVVILAGIPAILYWFFESPVQMVVAGGVAQALLLPLIGAAAVFLRHRHLPAEIRPSTGTTILLWVATAVMAGFALYYVWSRLGVRS
jgi:manganese transport protein